MKRFHLILLIISFVYISCNQVAPLEEEQTDSLESESANNNSNANGDDVLDDSSVTDLELVRDPSLCNGLDASQLNKAKSFVGVKLPSGFNLAGLNNRVSLVNLDLSQLSGVTPTLLNRVRFYSGIKFPDNFDVSTLTFSNKDLIDMDFSNVQNLTVAQLNLARRLDGAKFPDGFDITGLDLKRKISTNLPDLSNIVGLTTTTLNELDIPLKGIKFPNNFDVSGLDITKSIEGIDFSNTTGLTLTMLHQASSIRGVRLPNNFDLTALDLLNKDPDFIIDVDFSNTTGLGVNNLNVNASNGALISLDGVKLPDGFDVTNLTLERRSFARMDFSNTVGLTIEKLKESGSNNSLWTNGIILPTGFNASEMTFYRARDLDLSKTVGITPERFQYSFIDDLFKHVVYKFPDNLDISRISLPNDYELLSIDLSNVRNLNNRFLENAENYYRVKLPAGYDLSLLNTRNANLNYMDLSNVRGLTRQHLYNSKGIIGVKLPPRFDLSGLFIPNKSLVIDGIDFSNTVGLTHGSLLRAESMTGITLPAGFDFSYINTDDMILDGIDFSAVAYLCN